MKIIYVLLTAFISFYFLFGIFLFISQRSFMYFPSAEVAHPFQTEHFSIDGETISVVVLNKGIDQAVMYFGGNGETVVNNAPNFARSFSQHTIYLVNYRGYGGSTGNPSEKALYADALHIYDQVSQRHKSLSVIGRSLGTGVTTFLASQKNIHKMVLITPYDSILSLAQKQYPFYPLTLLLKDRYNSLERIKNIESACLVLIAENDLVIPRSHSDRLIQQFPKSQITVKIIEDVDHNSLSQDEQYYAFLQQFI